MISKDEATSINTPTNISSQLTQSPKDKVCLNSLSPNGSTLNDVDNLSSNVKNGENFISNTDALLKQEVANNQSQSNASVVSLNGSGTLILKRSLLFRNIYEDDHDLRHGLLYDFSCEHDVWDLPLPRNRRVKGNSNINSYSIDLDKDFGDNYIGELSHFKNKDPYEFNDIDDSVYHSKVNAANVENILHNFPIPENGTVDSTESKFAKIKSENELFCTSNKANNVKQLPRNDDEIFSDLEFFNSSGDESTENFQTSFTVKNSNGTSTLAHNEADSFTASINNSSILSQIELMYPTPPSVEAMVASPCNNFVSTFSKNEKLEGTQESIDKKEIILPNSPENDIKVISKVIFEISSHVFFYFRIALLFTSHRFNRILLLLLNMRH